MQSNPIPTSRLSVNEVTFDRCADRLGLVKDAKAQCPVCQRIYTTYRKKDDPQEKPCIQPFADRGVRSTCGAPECEDAEVERVLRPKVNAAYARLDAARERETQALKAAEERKLKQGLKRLDSLCT